MKALLFSIFVFSTVPAFSYLDPGTGTFIVQILVAGFFGSLLFMKSIWQKIGDLVSRFKQKKS